MRISNNKKNVKQKSKSAKSLGRKIIIIIASIVLICALILAGLVARKYISGRMEQKKYQELYNPTSDSSSEKGNNGQTAEIDPKTGVVKDFNKLYEINKDVVGWISIPDTLLDLPVVKSTDNAFYLNKTLEKNNNPFGTPFADYKATISKDMQSTNVTIYGHAAKDGSYFGPVKQYKKIDYYKEHPTLTFNTIYGNGEYKIIGLFMENVSQDNLNMFNYHDMVDLDEAGFNSYIENVMARNYFTTSVDVKFGDQLVTLSTCDTEVDGSTKTPYRLALVARKVRPGESEKVDVSKAANNVNQIMPDGWVKEKGKKNPFQK